MCTDCAQGPRDNGLVFDLRGGRARNCQGCKSWALNSTTVAAFVDSGLLQSTELGGPRLFCEASINVASEPAWAHANIGTNPTPLSVVSTICLKASLPCPAPPWPTACRTLLKFESPPGPAPPASSCGGRNKGKCGTWEQQRKNGTVQSASRNTDHS